jgi:hypothetical protein
MNQKKDLKAILWNSFTRLSTKISELIQCKNHKQSSVRVEELLQQFRDAENLLEPYLKKNEPLWKQSGSNPWSQRQVRKLPKPKPKAWKELMKSFRGVLIQNQLDERDYWHKLMEEQSTLEQRLRAEEIINQMRLEKERGEAPLPRS